MNLHRVIYGSRASDDILPTIEAHVDQIVATSRRNNAAVGVTGMLLCHRGLFVQVLEGDRSAVEAVYQRVQRDPRHSAVRRVSADWVSGRLFGEWTMCAASLSGADARILDMVGDMEGLDPEFLDPIPTLNLLSAVAQMRSYAAAA